MSKILIFSSGVIEEGGNFIISFSNLLTSFLICSNIPFLESINNFFWISIKRETKAKIPLEDSSNLFKYWLFLIDSFSNFLNSSSSIKILSLISSTNLFLTIIER